MDIQGKITEASVVTELWGKEFAEFLKDKRVTITDDGFYVKLSQPVKLITGEVVDVVKINEPTVGEMKVMDGVKGDIAKTAVLMETIAGITTEAANKMKARDYMIIGKIVGGFLLDGQETT